MIIGLLFIAKYMITCIQRIIVRLILYGSWLRVGLEETDHIRNNKQKYVGFIRFFFCESIAFKMFSNDMTGFQID